MRVLNVKEFDEYCKRFDHPCFVFSTENQKEKHATLHIALKLERVVVTLNPNRVSLIGERSRITMNNVKNVQVFDDVESIGIKINIICAENKKDIAYTFLID